MSADEIENALCVAIVGLTKAEVDRLAACALAGQRQERISAAWRKETARKRLAVRVGRNTQAGEP